MATIDEDIEEKKQEIKKAEMRYQEALRSGIGPAQAGLELETLRNDLSSLEKQKQNPQPQAQPKKVVKSQEKPRTKEDILRDLNEARAKGDVNKIKELEAELRGSPINVNTGSFNTGEADQSTGTPDAPQNTQDSQPAQGSQSQTAQQHPAQNQTTPTPDAMAGHYSRDPNQSTTKPEEEKEGGEEKEPKGNTGFLKNFNLLGNVFGARNPNNVLYDRRDMMRGLADEATNMAATLGMQGQSWRQESNRNPYSEASKKASATNAQQMAANISANSATGQNQVGLVRMNNPMDVNAEEQKRAEARRMADERQEKQRTTEGQARAYLGEAQQLNTQGRNLSADELESRRLSLGNGTGTSTTEKDEPKKEETTEETPTEETPVEETQPEPQQPVNYNAQHIINALLGSSQGQDLRNGTGDENDLKMYNWVISQGVKPITPKSQNPNQWENEFITQNGDKGKEIIGMLREGRSPDNAQRNFAPNEKNQMNTQTTMPAYACGTKNAKPGYAIVGENGPEIVKMKGGEEVIPNDELFDRIVSDERMKYIKECIDLGLGMTPEDFRWIAKKQGGKFKFNDREYDWFNDDDWKDDEDDSVLNGYAEHIKNYLYTYIPEAKEIDASIDPNQEHIGPMAQDIEKVNPACIVETPEGVKTVDTGRLAMMNAGAIGDLARQLKELKEVFING